MNIALIIFVIMNLLYFSAWVIYMLNVPKFLHIMQLESYQNDGLYRWIIKNPKAAFKRNGVQVLITFGSFFVVTLILGVLQRRGVALNEWTLLIEYFVVAIAFFSSNIFNICKDKKERKNAKKPLKYTARAKRLMFSNFLIMAILEVFLRQTFKLDNDIYEIEQVKIFLIYSFIILGMPLNIILANLFIAPEEDWINNHYINKARRKLNKKEYKDLIRIGITGSYGKTSTKFILSTILSEKYNVLATPGSYNTTMGNVKIIREELKPEHQVFISEMGARKRYDIQEICNFVRPQIGIITSVGPQHLETFKSIENVAKTKGELLKGLTEDGVAILPKDNEYCFKMYKDEKHEKYLYSVSDQGADVYAKNIKVDAKGSTFTLVTKDGKIDCTTKLLGEHNIQNILGCVAIALHLGLSLEQIANGISKIEPVEHRLQILPTSNGTTVIDDAFNSNPVGSKRALDIIKKFDGRKIIITPGMVELGAEEENLNREFGKQIGESVDIAILVGVKRSMPIEEGIRSTKFIKENIYVVPTLDDATKTLAKITKAGDVILFENDLPDNYNE